MRLVRLALLLGGATLLLVLVIQIGPAAVASSFSELSWRLLVILWFPFLLVTAADTLGWKFAFTRDTVSFRALLSARLAGEAINATTPTASVGGEAVKAWLLRPHAAMAESLPSVIIAKTTITIAQTLFLLVGIGVAWGTLPGDAPLLRAMVVLLGLEVIGVGGFVLVQLAGVAGGGGRILQRVGVLSPGGSEMLSQVDRTLARFYGERPGRLGLSVIAHFFGWLLSALETYAILFALGLPVSWATATVIEAFGTGIRFASFMVPAHVGALEGGHVAIFVALGLPAPSGLAFSLVRRIREAFWIGVGLLALAMMRRSSQALAGALEPEG